jgi:hypothetical protein
LQLLLFAFNYYRFLVFKIVPQKSFFFRRQNDSKRFKTTQNDSKRFKTIHFRAKNIMRRRQAVVAIVVQHEIQVSQVSTVAAIDAL